MNLVRYTWGVHHDAAGSYVIEREDGAPTVVFGPMPAGIVTKFLAARQDLVRSVFDRAVRELNR